MYKISIFIKKMIKCQKLLTLFQICAMIVLVRLDLYMFVRLTGWQTSREIVEHEGILLFEVAEMGHCSICQSRISHVYNVVASKQLKASYGHIPDRFPRDARTLWVGLEKPKVNMSDIEKKEFFREQLDLPIL